MPMADLSGPSQASGELGDVAPVGAGHPMADWRSCALNCQAVSRECCQHCRVLEKQRIGAPGDTACESSETWLISSLSVSRDHARKPAVLRDRGF